MDAETEKSEICGEDLLKLAEKAWKRELLFEKTKNFMGKNFVRIIDRRVE